MIFWFTGQPGSGKTTLGKALIEKLDKVKARKAAISAFNAEKEMPEGINIKKVKRVKRS